MNILFRYPPSMHRLILHHDSQKTQESGGKTAIGAVPQEFFGTMDAGTNVRVVPLFISRLLLAIQ
jgi:hypothetical protein